MWLPRLPIGCPPISQLCATSGVARLWHSVAHTQHKNAVQLERGSQPGCMCMFHAPTAVAQPARDVLEPLCLNSSVMHRFPIDRAAASASVQPSKGSLRHGASSFSMPQHAAAGGRTCACGPKGATDRAAPHSRHCSCRKYSYLSPPEPTSMVPRATLPLLTLLALNYSAAYNPGGTAPGGCR